MGAGFSGPRFGHRAGQRGLRRRRRAHPRAPRSGSGGTWFDNSYPGCRCDVPSNLYSFSFAPNPNWSETFSGQPEIERYLQDTARRLRRAGPDRLRGRSRVGELGPGPSGLGPRDRSWPAHRGLPHQRRGRPLRALHPRLDRRLVVRRDAFHSAQWDHEHDLTGRQVAIIGTGASTIQFLPHVQREAGHVTLFQRTPPWVFPHRNRPTRSLERVGLPAAALDPADLPGPQLLDGRAAAGHHAHPQQPDAERLDGGSGQALPGAPGGRPRAAGQGDADLHAGLQAPAAVERLLPGPAAPERLGGDGEDHRGGARGPRHRRRRAARGGHHHLRHGLPRHRQPDGRAGGGRRWSHPQGALVGRAACRPIAGPPFPASPTSSCWPGPTPASAIPRSWS